MANGIELATAYVALTVDGSQVNAGVRKSLSGVDAQADAVGRSSGKKMGAGISTGILGAVGKLAGPLAAIFAGIKVGQFLGDSIDEAIEAQKVGAATDAIIKSTGGVAKVSADNVAALSEALSVKVGVDDELIQSGANLLLTFKNVRNEAGKGNKVFDQAVTLTQDLAAAGFGSIESASKMLGKALNDPVKGMTALGRAGVTFTDGQKKQIKALVASGDLLGAQKVVLAEIASQVGGVGEATATTGEKVRVAWANVKEQLGTALLPVLERVGKWFLEKGIPAITAFITALTGNGDPTAMVAEGMGKFAKAGQIVHDVITKVSSVVSTFFGALTGTADPLGMVDEGMSGVAKAGNFLHDVFVKVWPILKDFGSWLVNDLWPALKDGWETIQPGLERARTIIADAFGGEGGGGDIKKFASFVTDTLIPAIATFVNDWLPVMAAGWAGVADAARAAGAVFEFQATIVRGVANVIITALKGVIDFAITMLDALSTVPGMGWAKTAADNLRGVRDKADEVSDAINNIPTSKTFTMHFTSTGQLRLPNGVNVDMGVWRARAHGGPVQKGQPYIVGEQRPELFIPNQSGRIVPRVPEATATSRSVDSSINVYGDIRTQSPEEFEAEMYRRRRRSVLAAPGR